MNNEPSIRFWDQKLLRERLQTTYKLVQDFFHPQYDSRVAS